MHDELYRFGLKHNVCFKNAFASPSPPPAPTPVAPPPVPDINSPANLAAQKQKMAMANAAGRSSTQLSTAAPLSTLAGGGYSGTKAGG